MSIVDRVRGFLNPPVELADKQARPELDIIGGSGTAIFSGFISGEEYNAELTGDRGRKTFDKMYRTDAQVAAAIRVCILPLVRSTWSIEPASDDEKDHAIAEALENNLFETLSIPWADYVRQLTKNMLIYGFMLFEECWKYDQNSGLYHWDKFAPRLPRTLLYWNTERNQLKSVTQNVVIDGFVQQPVIPAEKLQLFVHDQDGDNYEGTSVLRQAYPNWYFKQNLYRIEAIAAERHGTGIPVMKYPPQLSQTGKGKIASMLQHLQAHEKQYLAVSTDYEFELAGLKGALKSNVPFINYLDRQIAKCVLAQFIETGTDGKGSYALHEDQSDLFLMALEAMADGITSVIQRKSIREWVDINFGPRFACPKLVCSGLRNKNIERYANAVSSLGGAGGIHFNRDTENRLRELLDLPELPEEEQNPATDPDINPPESGNPAGDPHPPDDGEGEPEKEVHVYHGFGEGVKVGFWREKQRAERYVEFEEIDRGLDTAVDEFIAAAKEAQQKQIDSLVEIAAKIIEGRKLDKVSEISIPYKGEMASSFVKVLKDLYAYGRQTVKEEVARQRRESGKLSDYLFAYEPPEPLGEAEAEVIREYLKAKGAVSADHMAGKLKAAISGETLRQLQAGIIDRAKLRAVLEDLSSRELKAAGQVSVVQAFNYGRRVQSKIYSSLIKRVQYSALLDDNTCDQCSPMDGEEWDFDDPMTDKYAGGNPDCEGGPRCRCLLIYITEAETPAEK